MMTTTLMAATTPGVYYAFQYSDNVGKTIVIVLLIGSILTWTVMLDKAWELFRAHRMSKHFIDRLQGVNDSQLIASALIKEVQQYSSPVGEIYRAGVEKVLEFYEESGAVAMPGRRMPSPIKLSEAQLNAVDAVLERQVSGEIQTLETRIGFLATLVSLSPFLGLFGTVWGVMMAFCGIAAAGKSDFTALAPGVAGALLTTVAGLIVAIPSLVGYNYLTATIRKLTVLMDNFSEEFMVRLKLSQLKLEKSVGTED